MSLLKTFPEIDSFFKLNQFSETDLKTFIDEVTKKYSDKNLRKAAINLINLEILKYDIQKDQIDLTKLRKPIVTTAESKTEENFSKTSSLKKLSIESISEILKWSFPQLQRLLSQKGIKLNKDDVLNKEEFQIVEEMFSSRLIALKRIRKNEEYISRALIKNKRNSNNTEEVNDVYSKIATIGIGKIIYIRKS
jgi:hypothetical protein